MLVTTAEILESQKSVLAVNVVTLEHAEAFIKASEATGKSLVMQLSENAVKFHGGIRPLGLAMLTLALDAKTDIAVHLDHATSRELVTEAMELGFSSVMFDGSKLETEQNIQATKEEIGRAHV